jgi:threonine/homoserine/homoserine lactone efflux protein
MQLLSGIYLLVAVNKIRSFLVARGMGNQVNYRAMYLHGISFTLYNLTIIVFYTFYFLYHFDENSKTTRTVLLLWIGTTFTSFAAQICLVAIFMQFREKR